MHMQKGINENFCIYVYVVIFSLRKDAKYIKYYTYYAKQRTSASEEQGHLETLN